MILTPANDPWPVYREEDCTWLAFCDADGCKVLAHDATHYLANDPNGSTRMFVLAAPVRSREFFERMETK